MLANVLGRFRSVNLPGALSRRRKVIVMLFSVFVVPISTGAQSTTLTAGEQQALLAFNPTAKVFSSITFSGETVWTAGSLQDAGNVVFTASADGSSNETWSLASQPYSVASTSFADGRTCSSVDSVGKTHQDASPACLRAVPWFAPWMSLLMLPNNILVRTTGTSVAADDVSNVQLEYATGFAGQSTTNSASALMRSGTVVRLVLDPNTSLINEMDFNQIIDSDMSRVIPYRIVYSDYRPEAGLILPHHIQRFIQHTLQADITISNITAQ